MRVVQAPRIQFHDRIPRDNPLLTVVGCLALLLVWQASAAAGKKQPIDVIKTATQNIVTQLNAMPAIRTNVTELRRLVEQNIIPCVDLAGLSRLTLGKYWREATPQQRETFEGELHILLTRTYSASMSRYRNQSVEYGSSDIAPNKRMARVRTHILEEGKAPIAVDYSLRYVGNEWKIYDVSIAGISLVLNFRTTFAAQIRKDGLDGLIQQLGARNASAGVDDALVRKSPGGA